MRYEDGPDNIYWVVRDPDTGYSREDGHEVFDGAEAQRSYADAVKRWTDTPNWEAQARYDEAHGTHNGYSEWQLNREY